MPRKSIRCECGAGFEADNDDQLVAGAQHHARDVHGMALTRDEVLAMAQPIETPADRRSHRTRAKRPRR